MNHHVEQLSLPAHPELLQSAQDVLNVAEQADGVAPLSEQFVLGLSDPDRQHKHFVLHDGPTVTALAAYDGASAEMVVAPAYRCQGYGAAVLSELHQALGDVSVWAHGDLPSAKALAESAGLEAVRTLLVMEVTGEALKAASEFASPEGFTALNLEDSIARWGRAGVEKRWLEVNNEAFDWHPEQGGWDLERLQKAQEVDWFDPKGVLFLWQSTPGSKSGELRDNADETGLGGSRSETEMPPLAGFHWTKWHRTQGDRELENRGEFGEIYVVGLAREFQGKGLGSPVTRLGICHLVDKGAELVNLYVEGDNLSAVRTYEKLGFGVAEAHILYGSK